MSLRALEEACRMIVSDRIKERRQNAGVLLGYLAVPANIEILDKNSEIGNDYTWSAVFTQVSVAFFKEDDHSNNGKLAKTFIDPFFKLFKLTVSQANKGKKVHLKTNQLINHILRALNREGTRSRYCSEYSKLFQREVLENKLVLREVNVKAFNDFIEIYVDIYVNGNENEQICAVLKELIRYGSKCTKLNTSLLFRFFQDVICSCRKKLQVSQQESLFNCCLTFCQCVAADCRMQLCNLGENIFPVILSNLNDSSAHRIKDVAIKLLKFQMICHHPKGVVSPDDGMFAVDAQLWHRHLYDLYEWCFNQLRVTSTSGRQNSLRNLYFGSEELDLFVDVYNQMNYLNLDLLNELDEDAGHPNKRIKIEIIGASMFVSHFYNTDNKPQDVILWLQVLLAWLEKHSKTICHSADVFNNLANAFYHLQSNCKRLELTSLIMNCISSLLCAVKTNEIAVNFDEIWEKIYDITLRTVSLKHCVTEGFGLIRRLIEFRIIRRSNELLKLFNSDVSSVTHAALLTLESIITNGLLEIDRSNAIEQRKSILNWMFPSSNTSYEVEPSQSQSSTSKTNVSNLSCESSVLIGELAFRLILADQNNFRKLKQQKMNEQNNMESWLENDYLTVCFTQPFLKSQQDVSRGPEHDIDGKVMVVGDLPDKLLQVLLKEGAILVDPALKLQTQHLSSLLNICVISVTSFALLLKCKIWSDRQLARSNHCNVLQKLLSRVTEILKVTVEDRLQNFEDKYETLVQALGYLEKFYHWEDSSSSFCQMVTQFCREMTSEDFVLLLEKLLFSKISITPNQQNGKNFFLNNGFKSIAEAPIEIDLYVDQLKLLIIGILGSLCQNARAPLTSPLRPPEASRSIVKSNRVIQTALLDRLLSDNFELRDRDNSILAIAILSELLHPSQLLTESQREKVLVLLKTILNAHFKDPDLSACCINLLAIFVKQLRDGCHPETSSCVLKIFDYWYKSVGKKGWLVELALSKAFVALLSCKVYQWEDTADLSEVHPYCLTKLLASDFRAVNSYVAQHLSDLFDGDSNLLATEERHIYILKLVCQEIKSNSNIEEKTHESLDLKRNWIASSIVALVNIAISSPHCLKPAFLVVCKLLMRTPSALSVIRLAIKYLSITLGYPSCDDFIRCHLPYYLYKQLADDDYQDLDNHRIWLLTSSRNLDHFYEINYKSIVPLLFISHPEHLDKICVRLKRSRKEVIEECFPPILAGFILPGIALEQYDDVVIVEEAIPKIIEADSANYLERLYECLTQEKVNSLILSRRIELVVEVFKCLYIGVTCNDSKRLVSKPNSPYYGPKIVAIIFNFLTIAHFDGETSIVKVLCQTPDAVEEILLSLEENISKCFVPSEIFGASIAYYTAVKMILEEFATCLKIGWAYFLQNVIHTIVNHIQKFCKRNELCNVTLKWCQLLNDLVAEVVDVCSKEFGKYVTLIVNCLVDLVNDGISKEITDQALITLELIVIQSESLLKEFLLQLEPFPNNSQFTNIALHLNKIQSSVNLSFEEEIACIISRWDLDHSVIRCEGLLKLLEKLHLNRNKFSELAKPLKDVRFSNECKNTLIYRLIRRLVSVCCSSSPSNENVAIAAAKCLGEFGPISLSTFVLEMDIDLENDYGSLDSVVKLKSFEFQRLNFIFDKLHSYLLTSCVETKRLASDTLKQLIATKIGQQFIKEYKKANIGHLHHYLESFINLTVKSNTFQAVTSSNKISMLELTNCWCPDATCTFDNWICKLTTTLLEFSFTSCEFKFLTPICKSKVDFCEQFIPYLIHSFLIDDEKNGQRRATISQQINAFLEMSIRGDFISRSSTPSSYLASSDPSNLDIKNNIFKNKKAVNVILDVVKFLRLQQRPSSFNVKGEQYTVYDNNFWLDLDYLLLAETAYSNKANLTALLYAEIWWNTKSVTFSSVGSNSVGRSLFELSSTDDESNYAHFQSLLLKIYNSMGDCDSKSGCGTGHLRKLSNRLDHYRREGMWDRALTTYNLMIKNDSADNNVSTNISMLSFNLGLDKISDVVFKERENNNLCEDYQYECAWKMAQWVLPNLEEEKINSFDKAIYHCFVAFRDVQMDNFSLASKQGYLTVIEELVKESFETTRSLYKPLSQLAALNHLEECFDLRKRSDIEALPSVMESWSNMEQLFECAYTIKDLILSTESIALKLWCCSDERLVPLRKKAVSYIEKQVKLARENGHLQWAETYLADLKKMEGTPERRLWWRLEEAKVLWNYNERDTAKGLLQYLIKDVNKNETFQHSSLAANCYLYIGMWTMEMRSESASVILENYLEKAIMVGQSCASDDLSGTQLMEALLAAARFADNHYQRVSNYKKSDLFEIKQNTIEASQSAMNLVATDRDMKKAQIFLKKRNEIDSEELKRLENVRQEFLLKSLKYYSQCISMGSEHDSRIFRIIALWNENRSDDKINDLVHEMVKTIPSYKFIPLIRQLSARLKLANQSRFFEVIEEIIFKVSCDHPYHTLLILFSLSHAAKDHEHLPLRKSKSSSEDEVRVLAARNMIDRLRKVKNLSNIIFSMEKVCLALIDFSYFNRQKEDAVGSVINIDSKKPIMKLKNVENVPPLTVTVPVDQTGNYGNVVGISKFDSKYKLCDGISKPKQIVCVGSDGKKRFELVKGGDDLRQDAVMQQVFEMVNIMLKKNHETKRRGLLIRTYKVIPLSRKSGIIEWCDNTEPIGMFLKNDEYRKKFYSKSWPMRKCLKEMLGQLKSSFDKRYRVYREICENCKPIFRYFFFEKFLQPSLWYEQRMAYVKSVATTSIVGYILGLGDRHVSNILIDKKTAELIHIDFGVAFDQGKELSTAETVPFRLTRELVDGMGTQGYEGTFRRCCEHTLSVMRDSQEVVLTILEVLLYDPLYQWTLTPLQKQNIQNTLEYKDRMDDTDTCFCDEKANDEQIDQQAQRVLHRMKEKLMGQEDATILSVAGQVSHLIREATDDRNLCLIYHGWMPFL